MTNASGPKLDTDGNWKKPEPATNEISYRLSEKFDSNYRAVWAYMWAICHQVATTLPHPLRPGQPL